MFHKYYIYHCMYVCINNYRMYAYKRTFVFFATGFIKRVSKTTNIALTFEVTMVSSKHTQPVCTYVGFLQKRIFSKESVSILFTFTS